MMHYSLAIFFSTIRKSNSFCFFNLLLNSKFFFPFYWMNILVKSMLVLSKTEKSTNRNEYMQKGTSHVSKKLLYIFLCVFFFALLFSFQLPPSFILHFFRPFLFPLPFLQALTCCTFFLELLPAQLFHLNLY